MVKYAELSVSRSLLKDIGSARSVLISKFPEQCFSVKSMPSAKH